MTPAEMTKMVLAAMVALYGDDHAKACGTAQRLAVELGAEPVDGFLIDCVGQRHMHKWATHDGEVIDPLASGYDGPVRYESVDCPGQGRCHSPVVWCDLCGDVYDVCDDADCDRHKRECETCGKATTTVRVEDGEGAFYLCAACAEEHERQGDGCARALPPASPLAALHERAGDPLERGADVEAGGRGATVEEREGA